MLDRLPYETTLACAALFAASLTGCAPEPTRDSTHIATEDLDVTAGAASDGTETVVGIRVHGPRGDVRLASGDRMRLFAGGVSHDLKEITGEDGAIIYEARFGDVAGEYEVRIIRPHDISAEGLFFTMPPAFTLAGPASVGTEPIALAWDAGDAGDASTFTLVVSVEGPCIQRLSRPLSADTGAYSIQPAELVRTKPGACTLSVSLQRTSTAEMPVVFRADAGSFRATAAQRRTIEVEWAP